REFRLVLYKSCDSIKMIRRTDPVIAGVWREYLNGEVIKEYPGNTLPGTREFDYSTLLKKTSQDLYWQK
ncbi:hypothetical protein, partial [Xylanibacter ruminicola]|uniref:hypothetical protein n=1 Tax=Xylanibacter ruminicola TaxID=839 RepID=UPI001C31E5F3